MRSSNVGRDKTKLMNKSTVSYSFALSGGAVASSGSEFAAADSMSSSN